MQDKEYARKLCIMRREEFSSEEVHNYSHSIATKLFCDSVWRKARSIVLYSSIKNEVSTDSLLRQAWQEGKQVMLPRCVVGNDSRLELAICRSWEELVPGQFGILEPDKKRCHTLSTTVIPDLAIIPAVGLTIYGDRLGYGKGYYDKLLSQNNWNQVIKIALIYSFQLIEFKANEFDIPMNGYITELGLKWI